jgi:hypothetical protein
MKIKMNVVYGDTLCEYLKEAFSCDTDDELFIAFRAVMKAALAKECADPEDLSISFERID